MRDSLLKLQWLQNYVNLRKDMRNGTFEQRWEFIRKGNSMNSTNRLKVICKSMLKCV